MTTFTDLTLTLNVLLESGLHIGTGFGLARLLDEHTTRGPGAQGSPPVPYIPGASLKGRLRAQSTALVKALAVEDGPGLCDAIFGTVRQQGRLVFPDAHLIDADRRMLNEFRSSEGRIVPGALAPYLALEERAHVALSHTRRTARENMLMRIEVASPGLRLATVIRGRLPERRQARRALALVGLAARGITHLGGHKGRGLGAVTIAVAAMTLEGQEVDLTGVCEELL